MDHPPASCTGNQESCHPAFPSWSPLCSRSYSFVPRPRSPEITCFQIWCFVGHMQTRRGSLFFFSARLLRLSLGHWIRCSKALEPEHFPPPITEASNACFNMSPSSLFVEIFARSPSRCACTVLAIDLKSAGDPKRCRFGNMTCHWPGRPNLPTLDPAGNRSAGFRLACRTSCSK